MDSLQMEMKNRCSVFEWFDTL